MKNNSNISIIVLLGGTSAERAVSKDSGKSIYLSLKKLGFNVSLIDPAYGTNQPKNIEQYFSETEFTEISNKNIISSIDSGHFDNIDLVFIALHGKYGEDGIIQSLLELRGIKYTGSKVLPSALAMDKIRSKKIFLNSNVNTPNWLVIKSGDYDLEKIIFKIDKLIGYPCVIKSNNSGSSLGLTICNDANEICDAVKYAEQYSDLILIEEYIAGRELTVGILGEQVFPVLEIIPKSGLYDYKSKYTSGMSNYIVPAEIPVNVKADLQAQALTAYNSLGCSIYGRVDFRLSDKDKPYCLEVNNLPGMTNTSLFPKMAGAFGLNFDQLINKIVELSIDNG